MDVQQISRMAAAMAPSVKALLGQVWMPGDWFRMTDEVVSHYAHKAAVCRMAYDLLVSHAGPAHAGLGMEILEIGTRAGYSAAVFRQAVPSSRMLCFDGKIDDDSDACLAHAERTFGIADVDAKLVLVDMRDVMAVPVAWFAHIDGDHSFSGAGRDLRLTTGSRFVLLDDVCNPEVERAMHAHLKLSGKKAVVYDDGLRKAAVIE